MPRTQVPTFLAHSLLQLHPPFQVVGSIVVMIGFQCAKSNIQTFVYSSERRGTPRHSHENKARHKEIAKDGYNSPYNNRLCKQAQNRVHICKRT